MDGFLAHLPAVNMLQSADPDSAVPPKQDLGVLYRDLAPGLVSFCYGVLKSPAAARDATQEAFTRVLVLGPVLLSKKDFKQYIYRAAFNICLNELRGSRRVVFVDDVNIDAVSFGGEDALVDALFAQQLLSACDANVRRAAIACIIEGYRFEEAAYAIGVSRRSLYNWLQRLKAVGEHASRDRLLPSEPLQR